MFNDHLIVPIIPQALLARLKCLLWRMVGRVRHFTVNTNLGLRKGVGIGRVGGQRNEAIRESRGEEWLVRVGWVDEPR